MTKGDDMDAKGKDLVLKCCDCGAEFTWYSADQEFFASKGFTAPKRCKDCRAQKKANRMSDDNRGVQTGRFQTSRPNRSNGPR